jgi:hypothetical protein
MLDRPLIFQFDEVRIKLSRRLAMKFGYELNQFIHGGNAHIRLSANVKLDTIAGV